MDPVTLLRAFSRGFTQRLGLLADKPYDPALNLLESRVVFELARKRGTRAKELVALLGVDKGQLSRVLDGLRRRKLVQVIALPGDRREKPLALTAVGQSLFRKIDRVSHGRSAEWLRELGEARAAAFTRALASAATSLGVTEEIQLRGLEPGDLGWVIGRHGEIYADEYGWNTDFENLVAEIALGFARKHDSDRERAWIAVDANGARLGCVFLVRESDSVAKLRILLVDASARGLGLGTRLVRECEAFAKKAGYRKITLWTNDVLVAARRIYEAEGFRLVKEEPHESFGKKLNGQYWEKPLA